MNPLVQKFEGTGIILGSNSPRREQLFKELGLKFQVLAKDVDETIPTQFRREDIAMFLARKKALAYKTEVHESGLVITADTLVAVDDLILGKPTDAKDAERMLKLLSGRRHQVITGVCIMSNRKSESFFVKTDVSFKVLREEEIKYYIETCNPLDKAGAYGIQEWIGMVGVDYIQGSFYNVMGLPIKELYENLMRF
jgi:septum formation protein